MSTDPFEPLMTFKPRIAGKRSAAELCGLPARERRLIDLCYYQGKTPSQAVASHPGRREVQETDDSQRADWADVRSSS